MATAKKTDKIDLELHFLSLELASALKPAKKSNHLMDITLVCPRVSTARKTISRTVRLEDGKYAPVAPKWTESVVCKETVSGRFGLEVSLTEAVTDAAADYFVRNSANLLVKFLAGGIGGAIGVKALEDIAEIPLSALAKSVSREKAPEVICTGSLDLSVDDDFSKAKVLEIELLAAADVYKTVTRHSKSDMTSSRRKILSRGDVVGICRISAEAI